MSNRKTIAGRALALILVFTVLCGIIYPLVMTGISQLVFSKQSNGSIIEINGVKYGSGLLAQQFTGDEYLWGRIMNLDTETFKDSEGKPMMYAAPSNLSPASEKYAALVKERVEKIKQSNPQKGDTPIPEDLVTVSASGLDPDISPGAAAYQVARIAKARNMSVAQVQSVIDRYTKDRFLGIFGEKRVNVLQVNLALDGILK